MKRCCPQFLAVTIHLEVERLFDLFMGLTADELALTLPSPSGEGFLRGPRGAMNGIRSLSDFF
jgi:hypothetical protein